MTSGKSHLTPSPSLSSPFSPKPPSLCIFWYSSGEGSGNTSPMALSPLSSLSLSPSLSLSLSLSLRSKQLLHDQAHLASCMCHLDLDRIGHLGRSLVASHSKRWWSMQRVWEGRGTPSSSTVLQPFFMVVLGANKFLSTSSSKWYPSFVTKMPGLSARFSIQKRQILLVDPSQTVPYFEVTVSNSYSS